jgi:hypothetical protein
MVPPTNNKKLGEELRRPIITLLPIRLGARFSRLCIQRAVIYRASKTTRRYLWHSYIHHYTSSTDEAR